MRLIGYIRLIRDAYRPIERPKRSSIIGGFLTAVIFLGLLCLFVIGYSWALVILGLGLFSLLPFFVINMVYSLYLGYKSDIYLQKNHFKIWKLGKSPLLKNRLECMNLVRELDDPYLKSVPGRGDRVSQICLWVWLFFVLVCSLIMVFFY
jgi:hypothetical protein